MQLLFIGLGVKTSNFILVFCMNLNLLLVPSWSVSLFYTMVVTRNMVHKMVTTPMTPKNIRKHIIYSSDNDSNGSHDTSDEENDEDYETVTENETDSETLTIESEPECEVHTKRVGKKKPRRDLLSELTAILRGGKSKSSSAETSDGDEKGKSKHKKDKKDKKDNADNADNTDNAVNADTESEEEEEEEDDDEDTVTDEMFDLLSKHQLQYVSNMSTLLLSSPLKTYVSKVDTLTPDITDIVNNPSVKEKDKIKVCELYAIMAQYDPYTYDWIEARNTLKTRIRKAMESASTSHDQLRRLKDVTSRPLKERISLLDVDDQIKVAIFQKYREMNTYSFHEVEYAKLSTWIQFVLSVPFKIQKPIDISNGIEQFLCNAKNRLDNELYGMDKVKEQILLFLNKRLMNPQAKGCTLGLVGEKGVGKTAIIRSLANILDVPFEQLSCGGVTNSESIIGHNFTYIGAKCGMIVSALTKMKYNNGILFFDEFDKIQNIDVLNSMLHITDPSQNYEYVDQYLGQEVPVDLSNLWMVFAMNSLPSSEPLCDRMYTITVDGYNQEDKMNILREYMLKRVCTNTGLKPLDITISEDVAIDLVNRVSPSDVKGVRSMEKAVTDLVNKISFIVNTSQSDTNFNFSFNNNQFGKLEYPVEITRTMLNQLLSKEHIVETPLSFKMIYV